MAMIRRLEFVKLEQAAMDGQRATDQAVEMLVNSGLDEGNKRIWLDDE